MAVKSLSDTFPGPTDTRLMWVLLTLTGFLLLIACANVANLMLAGAAALLGPPMGVRGVRISRSAMPPQIPEAFLPELDAGVLLFTVVITGAAGLVFGLAPALHAVSGELSDALTAGSRGGPVGRRRRRIRNGFVMAEVAFSLGLLVGARMLISAMGDFMNWDPGFVQEDLLTFRVTLPEERYPDDGALTRFYRETVRTLESTSGVEMRRGRGLEEEDRGGASPVVVVNRELARRHFPDRSPVGERLTVRSESREIVGVAENVLHQRIIMALGAPTFGFVALLVGGLTATAVLASWLPARRAAGVQPVTALKEE